ncbi:MAG: ABC transporter substrate-binding protein [Lachnospiraceae bacterium]|nr:ABC transporter substrate-binding protein [Lachnospiraceae bacterium]
MKIFKNKVALLLAMLMLVVGLSACGEKANEDGKEAAKAEQTAYPLTVTDTNGESVTIEKEPQRVVSVAPNLTEVVYKLGAQDKLVGRSDYCDYPAEVSAIDSVGTITGPDVEKIISLNPDLVIVSTHFDEANAKVLDEAGIQVLTLYDQGDVNGVYTVIDTLGQALNKNAEADACVEDMKKTIADVETKVKDLEKPTVYYVVGYGEYGDYTAGGDTFIHGIIEAAGGDNIAKDISGWSISLEILVEADPKIIIINEAMKEDFMSAPTYCELTAVKEGRVYTLDVNMLERQGYRNAEGVKALAEIFHPEAFK